MNDLYFKRILFSGLYFKESNSMAYTSKNKIWFNDLQFHFSNEPTILGQINYPYYTITVGL